MACFFLQADYLVTYLLSNQWDQGSVMTDIQRSLVQAAVPTPFWWKRCSLFNYHSHPDTDLKLRQISTTSPLFVAGETLKPFPQLHTSLNLHLSLLVTLSFSPQILCLPSIPLSFSPYVQHLTLHWLHSHTALSATYPHLPTHQWADQEQNALICSARRQICEFIKALNAYTPL